MRNIFVFWGALLFVDGVFGVDVTLSVMKGDSVTLNPHTVIPVDDTAQWWFGDKFIAKINKADGLFTTSGGDNEGFNGRLNLDKQTGSLTITNITPGHAGLYEIKILTTAKTLNDIFNVTVSDVSGVDTDGVNSVSVMKGDTIPLFAGVTEIQKNYQVQLMFGDPGTLIADLNGPVDARWSYYICVDYKTGKLNIINSQSNQTGVYTVEINTSSWILHRKFHINVTDNVNSVSGKEGDTVTLRTGVTNIQIEDQIVWKFGDKVIHIPSLNGPVVKEWRNIYWNGTTGDLTISNIRNYQSGNYEVTTRSMILHKKFHINVEIHQRSHWETTGPVVLTLLVVLYVVVVIIIIENKFGWKKLFLKKKTITPGNESQGPLQGIEDPIE